MRSRVALQMKPDQDECQPLLAAAISDDSLKKHLKTPKERINMI